MKALPVGSAAALIALFVLCTAALPVAAQQKTKIILQSSQRSRIVPKTNITYLRNPVFKQDNALLSCDSAVFYTDKNYFEAYNNVHINQADTINIYSDRLNYDGNAKFAHLTSNVRLVDKSSTLTTNILDYNMVPKVGTYVDGGKIVNKDATITSKNGYYFANSRDAYFRYNVVVVTEQSTIKSDTLRYNTFSNWAYFYGPTNIREKDGGNLYTENGAYNTKTVNAYFGKNNLYTSGSRSLKGDSLYYDGKAGYGKAVRNIVSQDTVDKMKMWGQLGFYYKKDQRTLVTKNAYAAIGTNDSIMVKDVKQPDTLWLGADTLETQMVLQKTLKLIKGPAIKKDNELGEEDRDGKTTGKGKGAKVTAAAKKPGGPPPAGGKGPGGKQPPSDDKTKPGADVRAPEGAKPMVPTKKDSVLNDSVAKLKPPLKKVDSLLKVKVATTQLSKDSALKTAVPLQKKDSLLKAGMPVQKPTAKPDTSKTGLAQQKPAIKQLGPAGNQLAKTQAGVKKSVKDSLPLSPMDTVRTRIIKAYHKVNVFKTNMQAKSDSLFYTSADSTLRWYKNPMIWSQGSQQTGDTIYLQLRNKKINSIQVVQTAFSVNVEADSAKFNQIKGKLITGFFKDGKLNSMYVDGNAESVYFTKTDDGKKYDKMNQTISSRIKITFKNNDIADVVPIKNVEGATTPVAELKQDVLLTGFIWKPELRPRNKKDITNPRIAAKPKKPAAKIPLKPAVKGNIKDLKAAGLKALGGKAPQLNIGTVKQAVKTVDSLKQKRLIPAQSVVDSTLKKQDPKQLPALIKKADSVATKSAPVKN